MEPPQTSNPLPHKRTSSAAGNTTTEPDPKRREPLPTSYIYIVIIETTYSYLNYPESTTNGAYSTLADANNAVRRLANELPPPCDGGKVDCGLEQDGRYYWSVDDCGEGEAHDVRIQALKLQPAGSKPECELENDGVVEDGEDSDGDENED